MVDGHARAGWPERPWSARLPFEVNAAVPGDSQRVTGHESRRPEGGVIRWTEAQPQSSWMTGGKCRAKRPGAEDLLVLVEVPSFDGSRDGDGDVVRAKPYGERLSGVLAGGSGIREILPDVDRDLVPAGALRRDPRLGIGQDFVVRPRGRTTTGAIDHGNRRGAAGMRTPPEAPCAGAKRSGGAARCRPSRKP